MSTVRSVKAGFLAGSAGALSATVPVSVVAGATGLFSPVAFSSVVIEVIFFFSVCLSDGLDVVSGVSFAVEGAVSVSVFSATGWTVLVFFTAGMAG